MLSYLCARGRSGPGGSAVALVYLDQMRQRLSYDGTHFIKQAYVGYHQRAIDHAISCPGQRRACYACRPQAVVIAFVDGNGAWLTEIVDMDSIGLPGAPSRTRRDDRNGKGDRADCERDVGRAGGRYGCEKRREKGVIVVPTFCEMAIAE